VVVAVLSIPTKPSLLTVLNDFLPVRQSLLHTNLSWIELSCVLAKIINKLMDYVVFFFALHV